MRIGVPAEVKNHEYRVALTPAGAHALVTSGHTVIVQTGAGTAAGHPDRTYTAVGAQVVDIAEEARGCGSGDESQRTCRAGAWVP